MKRSPIAYIVACIFVPAVRSIAGALWRGLVPVNARLEAEHHWQQFRNLGPHGLTWSLRRARISKRITRIGRHIEREHDLHAMQIEWLNHERNQLLHDARAVDVAQRMYVDHCAKVKGRRA